MAESSSKRPLHYPSTVRHVIYVLLAVMLTCGSIYLCLYVSFNREYIRSNYVAAQALGQVEQIYEQIRAATPNGITLVSEEIPQSHTYAWGLSDDSPRYASVRAQQIYGSNFAFSDILTIYKNQLQDWGWVSIPLNSDATSISSAFSPSDDANMIVGLCSPPQNHISTETTQYIVFFDFDETQGCGGRSRLGCIAARYCENS